MPVRLPPGRARLATRPNLTGSSATLAGLTPLEDTTGVHTDLTIGIRNICCVGHQPADVGKLTPRICRGDREARCQLNQLDTSEGEQLLGADVEGVGPVVRKT